MGISFDIVQCENKNIYDIEIEKKGGWSLILKYPFLFF